MLTYLGWNATLSRCSRSLHEIASYGHLVALSLLVTLGVACGGAGPTESVPIYTITTASSPDSGGTTSGGRTYSRDDTVRLTATPNLGYVFERWTESGSVVSDSATYAFSATRNRTLVANFPLKRYSITTASSPATGGTTSGDATYAHGGMVTLTATPNVGYTFESWTESGSVVATNASYAFTATGNRSLVANFLLKRYSITTAASPATGGATRGDGTYTHGSTVTVTATPNPGYAFERWTEIGSVVSTSASYTFTVTGARALIANFVNTTIVLDSLDEKADWSFFVEGAPTWVIGRVTAPSLDGTSQRCGITGGASYSNVHCYVNLPPAPTATLFTLELQFLYRPQTSFNNNNGPSVVQALEFTMSTWQQGRRYEFAVQWQNVGAGAPQWRYWNPSLPVTARWVPTNASIPSQHVSDQWHPLILSGEIVNGEVRYSQLTVDGVPYRLDITVPSASDPGVADKIAVAVQVDGNFMNSPSDLFIDRVKLTYR